MGESALEWIRSDDDRFDLYCRIPVRPRSVAILLLCEIFGVNASMRATADRLSEAGYPVVVPDLHWRISPRLDLDPASARDRARAMDLTKRLNRDESVTDGTTALRTLRSLLPDAGRSAALGYCYGGGVAYLLAVRSLVDAGIAYYGTGIHEMLGEAAGLKGRLLLHVAGEDHLCPASARDAILAALDPLGPQARVIVHPGAHHAFARPGGDAFDPLAAARADAATMELLEAVGGGA